MRASFSIMNLPASAACQLVPQAMILTCRNARNCLRRDIHLVQKNAAAFLTDASEGGVANRARLLENFLEHEVLVAALFRHDRVPEDVLNLAVDRASVEIAELHAILREDSHIAIGEEKHIARVAEDGGHVGGDEVFALAETDDDRRTLARGDDLVRIPPARARPARKRRGVA